MYHFIPAWYQKDRLWYDDTNEWTHVNHYLQFDDSVNHIKVFHENQEKVRIMILNYSPHLRSFLHQKGLLEVETWSLFDHLQNCQESKFSPLDWRSLNWPAEATFLYSPFTVSVLVHDCLYARLQFVTNSNLFQIIRFEKDGKRVKEQLVFDDRGFLSSILYFKNGQANYQDYVNQAGLWCLREYLDQAVADRIIINPKQVPFLKQKSYKNWENLISEMLEEEIATTHPSDVFVIASHQQHNTFFKSIARPTVFSFYQNRQKLDSLSSAEKEAFADAQFLVSDTEKNVAALQSLAKEKSLPPIIQLSPFDSSFDLGLSIRQKVLEIYFLVDTVGEEDMKAILTLLFKEIAKNELLTLKLATYQRYGERVTKLQDLLETYLENYIPNQLSTKEDSLPDKNAEEAVSRADILMITEENHIISAFKRSRIVLDFGLEPDLYHQIAAISSGIPQINNVQTAYVSHKENGYIASQIDEISKGLDYYLKGLSHWNQSLVYSIEKIAENTGQALMTKWKAQLEDKND
ncbi:glycosylation associated protein, mature Fap1 export and glycosylation,gap1 [Streptococcus pseudoporcinus]|uniref:Glycosylation associated protein, mature Fap1 export and glycosylation,gap1 n=1 Tax=Streptococcus pseudoporcinus TaxID=361101 RepID=A0A4U9Z2V7_9STRE|nr:accessory Sec system protein Asp1 [Streptococcus pseudoporcinus]VTS33865.1 glycosylation associated protein, mature Fap1 export and glycosylation,gap1 [Streptococcus pseudoporcinus]